MKTGNFVWETDGHWEIQWAEVILEFQGVIFFVNCLRSRGCVRFSVFRQLGARQSAGLKTDECCGIVETELKTIIS